MGIPTYFLARGAIGNTGALFVMLGIMLPAFMMAMYEKDRKAESKYIKATAEHRYRATVQEHPEMQQGSTLSRLIQKQKIKRQYAKQAREAAKTGAKAAEKTAATTEKLTAKAVDFVKRHPTGILLALACVLLLVVMQSCMSSLVSIGNGTVGPRQLTVRWKPSCKAIWIATSLLIVTTSTISTWTILDTIPMC